MFKKAFTLAEVLIVIAIIGTVAAITVPNLSDSYKEDNTVVKLQKFQNELQSAQKQAIAKYGDPNFWNSNSALECNQRYLEFLENTQSGVTFPDTTINSTSNITKAELKDGSIIGIVHGSNICNNGNGDVYIATDGKNSSVKGKNIFKFTLNLSQGTVIPAGRGADRAGNNNISLSDNIMGTNWAITNGNLDYLKCAASLNWETKTSCD